MKIIMNQNTSNYIIDKSKFIGFIYKIQNIIDVNNVLNDIKNKYSDATHICYAYILPNSEKCSDDNEPSGCAGLPILDILKKNNLCYTLGIVVRYFGGIKLGSNGLIRAYSHTIKETLINNIKDIEEGFTIQIEIPYDKYNEINYLLKNSMIQKTEYKENIIINAIVNQKTLDNLSNVNIQIIDKIIY